MKKSLRILHWFASLLLVGYCSLQSAYAQQDTLSTFSLQGPADNATVQIYRTGTQNLSINWGRSSSSLGLPVRYKVLMGAIGQPLSPTSAYVNLNSDQQGADTVLSLTHADLIRSAGTWLQMPGVYNWQWTVLAYTDSSSAFASATFNVNLDLQSDTLLNYALNLPNDNDSLSIPIQGVTNTLFKWTDCISTSSGAVTYKVEFDSLNGTFANPMGRFDSDNNGADANVTLSNLQLWSMLNSAGYQAGISAHLKWRVKASSGVLSQNSDTENRLILLMTADTLASFHLLSPADNTTATVVTNRAGETEFKWSASNKPNATLSYTMLLDLNTGNFTSPIYTASSGADTSLKLSSAQLNAILAAQNVASGSSANLQWTVRVSDGSDSILADAPFAITLNRTTDTLAAFALVSPVDSTTWDILQNTPTNYNFSWDTTSNTSGAAVHYTLLIDTLGGNFMNPVASYMSGNSGADNYFLMNNQQLNNLLAGLSVGVGQGLDLQWTVKAHSDSVDRMANSVRMIRMNRVIDTLSNFALLSPASGASISVPQVPAQTYTITWNSSVNSVGSPVTYTWLLDTLGGSFTTPLASISANNSGTDTSLTLTEQQILGLLNSLSVSPGQLSKLQWTVRANSNTLTKLADLAFALDIDYLADTLTNFALLSPADSANVRLLNDSTAANVQISWASTSSRFGTAVTYTWMLDTLGGTFATPLASIASNQSGADTTLSLSNASVNALLSSLSVLPGQSFTGIWTVKASNGQQMRMADAARTLTIERVIDTLPAFTLLNPIDSATVVVPQNQVVQYQIQWHPTVGANQTAVRYTWMLDTLGGNFSTPLASIPSSNQGVDTVLNLSSTGVNALLASLGVQVGQQVQLQWTVKAYNASYSAMASQAFRIQFDRLQDTLRAFHLTAPADSAVLHIPASGTQNYSITWSNSAINGGGNLTYTWILDSLNGNFNAPWASVISDNSGTSNQLTLSNSDVLGLLNSLNVQAGQSITAKWTVKASGASQTRFADMPFVITLHRMMPDSLSAFSLLTPPDSISASIPQSGVNQYPITWQRSVSTTPDTVRYTWMLDSLSGNFSNPIVGIASANASLDSFLFLNNTGINTLLAGIGVGVGQSITLKWTVRADAGTMQRFADKAFVITLFRQPDTLSSFNLLAPANGTTLNLTSFATGNVSVRWTASTATNGAAVQYTWLLDLASGNFTSPLASLLSNNTGNDTLITLSMTQINALLNSLNVLPGQTANLKWTVKASSSTLNRLADSVFFLSIYRVPDSLSNFGLVSPANAASLNVTGSPNTPVVIRWNSSSMTNGAQVTYRWYLDLPTGNFSTPLVNSASDNGGADTTLTLTYGNLATLLAANSVATGTPITLKWTVKATSGTFSKWADNVYTITLTWNFLTGTQQISVGDVMLYPNPANEVANLRFQFDTPTDVMVRVLDVQGRVQITESLQGMLQDEVHLSVQTLPAGLYYVQITEGDRQWVRKLMIQR